MSLIGVAGKCGVMSSTLEALISGEVRSAVAMRLGTTSSSLQDFVNGGTSIGLAAHLGTTSSNVQLLRNKIGREGAIGLLIGLMAGLPSD